MQPLDEDALDEIAGRIASLPEPLALLATHVEVARADGDVTGVRKRLFDLGAGVARYAAGVGLAVLKARLGEQKPPEALGAALRKAARLSDGQWCELGRQIASALRGPDPAAARALAFLAQKPLAELVASRNLFAHGGGHGDDAPARTLAVLDDAAALFKLELRVVAAIDPPSFEARRGSPIRAGVWRKTKEPIPAGVEMGEAYLVIGGEWLPATPWLPKVEARLLLADAPHAPGKPWRTVDPESGEHREHTALTAAVRALSDDGAGAPAALTDRPPLVGRAAALGLLRRAAEEALRGGVRVVLLTGPFGIGRSHLAQVVKSSAAGLGFSRILDATCSPERRSTLRPLRRALEGAPEGDRVRAAVDLATSGDVMARREGIESVLEAVEEALVESSLAEPTLLSVDDAQWADDPTLSLLRLLVDCAGRGARGKLFVVVTARNDPTPSPALRKLVGLVEQDVGSAASRFALEPLAPAEAAQVVEGVGPIERELGRSIVHGAAGVPFFLVQPLLVWNETGKLFWKDKAWAPIDRSILDSAVPGVGDLVRARLSSFFDPGSDAERAAQQTLACVALSGAGLPIDDVAAAMGKIGVGEAAAEKALEALLEASLLRLDAEGREVSFVQPMVQRTLLEELRQKPWFRRAHRALLDVCAARGTGDGDAAFLSAGYEALGDAGPALHWAGRGIARALATGAFAEAVELGERLGRVGRTPGEKTRADLVVADALLRLGRASEAQAAIERARSRPAVEAELGVEARILAVAVAHALGGATAALDPGLIADADAIAEARLGVEARFALATSVRGAEGLRLADEGIANLGSVTAAQAGDLPYRLFALRLELLWESRSGDAEERRAAADRAAQAARALGSEWAELDMEMSVAAMEADTDPAAAVAQLSAVVGKARARRFGTLERQLLINIAGVQLRAGRPAEAAASAETAAAAARAAGSALLAVALSIRADALLQLGRPAEAFPAIEEAVRLKLAAGDANVAIALFRRAETHAALGRAADARADTELALARAEAAGSADHVARARLWLGIDAIKGGIPGAGAALGALLDELAPRAARLHAATRHLLEQGRALLEGAKPATPR